MATREQQRLKKLNRQAIGAGEAAQVIRQIQQRITYLHVHARAGQDLADRITALEQIAMAVLRVKFR